MFAANLRKLMDAYRLNQTEFAERIGVAQPLVSDWLNAKHLPNKSALNVISREFRVTEEQLTEGSPVLDQWASPVRRVSEGPIALRRDTSLEPAISEHSDSYLKLTPRQKNLAHEVETLLAEDQPEIEATIRAAVSFIRKSKK